MGASEDARSVAAAQQEARRYGYLLFVHPAPGREPLTHRATIAPATNATKGELGGYGRSTLEAALAGLESIKTQASAQDT